MDDLCYVFGWQFLTRPVMDPIHLPYMLEVLNTIESKNSFRITDVKEKLLFIEVNDEVKHTCRLPNNIEIQ